MTLNSVYSSKHARSRATRVSMSSQENIVAHPLDTFETDGIHGITVTREVSVTYETYDAPFVHASLVGLAQGEIANPWLARRRYSAR